MTALTEETTTRTKLLETLQRVKEIDPDKLVREELGTLSFKDVAPYFKRTKDLINRLGLCSFDDMPIDILKTLDRDTTNTLNHLNNIMHFSATPPQGSSAPEGIRTSYINSVVDNWTRLYNSSMRALTYEILLKDGVKPGILSLNDVAHNVLDDMREYAKTMREEMDTALKAVRDMVNKAGVEKRAANFKQEADMSMYISWVWFGIVIIFAICIVLYAFFILEPAIKTSVSSGGWEHVIANGLPKFLVISILTYMMSWSSKNYAACKHNLVVNRHRQIALTSFETFLKGSSDESTKNGILTHACQSIFAPQASGYLKHDIDMPQNSQIIEIVKSISGNTTHGVR